MQGQGKMGSRNWHQQSQKQVSTKLGIFHFHLIKMNNYSELQPSKSITKGMTLLPTERTNETGSKSLRLYMTPCRRFLKYALHESEKCLPYVGTSLQALTPYKDNASLSITTIPITRRKALMTRCQQVGIIYWLQPVFWRKQWCVWCHIMGVH